LLIGIATLPSAFADSSVDAKVQRIEERIKLLEGRVTALETQLREKNSVTPLAADKVPWRKLKKGMAMEEVEQLLGSPSDVTEYGISTTWRYRTKSGVGIVRFNEGGSAEGWSEP
jgi:hypothetical protein